jgi:hypothetical protein
MPARDGQRTIARQRPLDCRFSRFAARFSSKLFAGFFFDSFFRSIPLLIGFPLDRVLRVVGVYAGPKQAVSPVLKTSYRGSMLVG